MKRLSLEDAKRHLLIPDLWHHFGFPGEAKISCLCPFHDDRVHKSFSVSPDGKLWNCFAGCGGGDAIDFLARASGLGQRDACRKFVELSGGGSVAACPGPAQLSRERPRFPSFAKGTTADLRQLSKLRNIGLEGLQFASDRGLLWFATLKGFPTWIVTDLAWCSPASRSQTGFQLNNSKS